MIKKLLCTISIILITSIGIHAKEIGIVKAFYSKVTKNKAIEIRNLSRSDEFFQKGYSYLTDRDKMDRRELNNFFDKTKKKQTITLPNHIKAIVEFEKSVKKYKNPLSAYLGLNSLNFLIDAKGVEKVKRRKLFIETLYKQTNTCEGYIQYADMLMKGLGIKKDLNKSISVLREARMKCWNIATDLEKSLIEIKETQAKYKITLLNKKKK